MVDILDFIDEASDTKYIGNSLFAYLISLVIFSMSFIVLYTFKFVIIRRLSKMERVKGNTFLHMVINTLKKYFSFSFVIILSLYVSTRHLAFSPYFEVIIDFLVLTIFGWLIVKLAVNMMDAIIEDQRLKGEVNLHIIEFFNLVARSFLTVIVIIWVLSNVGVNVTSFLAGLGILSLGIAFALREIIADVFASIVLLIDKPFEIGDSIKIGDDAGTVESIGIRSSKIRATEGYLMISSNRELTSKRINNTKQMERRRVSITFQISQENPISKLSNIPLLFQQIISPISEVEYDKVNLVNIGDYSYDYELIYFVKVRDFKVHLAAKQQILYDLIERFDQEKIYFPYPTQTIIIDN